MSHQHFIVLYVMVPLWLLAGLADWACHARSDIEHTSGTRESALHLVMLFEVGLPLLAAIYLEVNALVLGLLCAGFLLHEATAYVDVRYTAPRRRISVFEQFVHSVLEMSPLMILLLLASAHWEQWLALWGLAAPAEFVVLKSTQAPSPPYTFMLCIAIALLALLPYVEEYVRARRARPHIAAVAGPASAREEAGATRGRGARRDTR